jgi:hypothetical protein
MMETLACYYLVWSQACLVVDKLSVVCCNEYIVPNVTTLVCDSYRRCCFHGMM